MEHGDLYYPNGATGGRRVILFDLPLNKPVNIDFGKGATNPKWAFKHNWLFYNTRDNNVMWMDDAFSKLLKFRS